MSVLDKSISYFPSTTETRKGVSVNLLKLLQSSKHVAIINSLRAESDPDKQGKIKEGLPCYTVAGTFSRRCEDGLLLPSGLAAVDLDSAEDYDVIPLLHELKKIPYIAYAGLSCRGKRIFAIIPFLYPDRYSKHYERLVKSFEDIDLPMGDTCHKAISQPRYISYNTDETCFYNHNAKLYHLLPPEKTYNYVPVNYTPSDNNSQGIPENPFKWCETHFQKNHSFAEGGRHKYIVDLSRYCNIKGIPESDTLSGCIIGYNTDGFDDLEITKIVKHIYSTQSASHNTNPFKHITKAENKKPKKPVASATQVPPTSSSIPPPSLPFSTSFSATPSPTPPLSNSTNASPINYIPCTTPDPPVRDVFDSTGTLYTKRPYPEICD